MNTSNTNDYSVFKDALGKRIQLLRTAASLTRTTIVDIEKGATNPTLEGLARIASALGLKVPDLLSSGVAHQSTYIMQPTSGNLYTPLVEQLTTVKNGELNIHVAYAKSSGVDLLTAARPSAAQADTSVYSLVLIRKTRPLKPYTNSQSSATNSM